MDKIQSFLKSSKGILSLSLLAILSVLISFGFSVIPSQESRITQGREVVQSIYNEDLSWIRADLTYADLAKVEESINRISASHRRDLEEKLNQAQHQLRVQEIIKPILAKNPSTTGQVLVKAGTTPEKISQAQASLRNLGTETSHMMAQYLDQAHEVMADISQGQAKFQEYKDMKVITRTNLQDAIRIVNESTEYLYPHRHQPCLQSEDFHYEEEMEHFTKTILNGYAYGEFREETHELIHANPILSENLKGTVLNPQPLIALTFDDGPNEEYTTQILDLLAQYDAKATFFAYGAYVDQNPEVARRIVNEGHILANHSYTHPDYATISDEEILQEIAWTQESIYDVTGYENKLYRMPFGSGGARVVELLPELTSIMWNLDSLDWQLQDSQLIYERVMANLSRDTLLLMHDTSQTSVDALAAILPELVDMGYAFVAPTELAYQNRYY